MTPQDIIAIITAIASNKGFQGMLVVALTNLVVGLVTKLNSTKLPEQVQLYIHPLYIVLGAITSVVDSLDGGTPVAVSSSAVSSFIVVYLSTFLTHLAANYVASQQAALKAKIQVKLSGGSR